MGKKGIWPHKKHFEICNHTTTKDVPIKRDKQNGKHKLNENYFIEYI